MFDGRFALPNFQNERPAFHLLAATVVNFRCSMHDISDFKRAESLAVMVVCHLQQLSGNSGWKVNGRRLLGSFQWKISGSNGTSEKVVLFLRTEC